MAFVHCHDCGWEQDDFWSYSYNPLESLLEWQDYLLDFSRLDESFTDDIDFVRDNGNISVREAIARECERAARNIRKMVFMTEKEYQNGRCPNCGSDQLDCD